MYEKKRTSRTGKSRDKEKGRDMTRVIKIKNRTITTFTSDMASLAYQGIYDALTLRDQLSETIRSSTKGYPKSAIRSIDARNGEISQVIRKLDEEIVNWVAEVMLTDKDVESDIDHLDELFGGRLSELDIGVIDSAREIANKRREMFYA